MSHLLPVRHDVGSLVQSLADEMASRDTGDERPTTDRTVVDAAARIAACWEAGKEAPDRAPQDLQDRHDGDVQAVWECMRLTAELLRARLEKRPDAARIEDELEFATCDPEFAQAVTRYEDYFGPDGKKRAIPYVRYRSMDDFVLETVAPDATVAVLGDWGTGTADARRVLEQVKAHDPDLVIHLGDVYYAGTPRECQRYFLDLLDEVLDRAAKPVPVYTLAGNHDMYSGGVGYYGLLPKLNPSPPFAPGRAQEASYFCLRTTDGSWQLLGMDTGLHDHDPFDVTTDVTYLDPEEEAWHADKLRRFSGRTVLLSHHQLFSAFEGIGAYADRPANRRAVNPKLLASFEAFQAAAGRSDGIAAWLWGHEHNLCVYQPYAGLGRGRCVGHGAIPVFVEKDAYRPLPELADDRPALVTRPGAAGPVELASDGAAYAHGFAVLELDGSAARVSYYQETSTDPLWVEDL